MRLPFKTVDVFTHTRFCGNPLAVVLEAGELSASKMQAIAREFNYSETAFVRPARFAGHTAELRIFTPTSEVPFAGHPNIGTAFVLASLPEHAKEDELTFEEWGGVVRVRITRVGSDVVHMQLTAPQELITRTQYQPDVVAECLGLSVADIRTMEHPPLIASVGLPFLVAELETRDALTRAKPRAEAFARHLPRDGADAIYIYTRDVARRDGSDIDFSARMFAPADGLPEDPATGSATAAAMALVARDMQPGEVRQYKVAQGVDMGRPCRLEIEIAVSRDLIRAVRVGGACVEVMEGFVRS
jgi:trans-2,3-dihydro-3-hydroxyanthranilate isomerase